MSLITSVVVKTCKTGAVKTNAALGMDNKGITITMMCQHLLGAFLVAAITFCGATSALMCRFPDNIQAIQHGEKAREWHGHITRHVKDKTNSYTYVVTFSGSIMKAVVSGGWKMKPQPKPYTRDCIQEVEPGKYLVQHKETGLIKDRFCCIQFLVRSGDVLQIKMSRLSGRENPRLCLDHNLVTDPWPYVNRVNLFRSYMRCSLEGGYNIMMFDMTRGEGICDAYHGGTRLESECMAGEGMFFRFRQDVCVPKGVHMHVNQRVYCMASWQEGANTYSVLRHDGDNHQWCFRHPTKVTNKFVAYLFKDLLCDTGEFPDPTSDYIQLDMVHDTPRGLSSLCMDDYEACNIWSNPCRHAGSVMSLSCARTCGICGDSRPATCTLPGKLSGKWLDATNDRKEIVQLSDMFLNMNGFRQMQCIKWHEGFYSSDQTSMEHMFVTTFDNGCRPRYQCAHFQRRTPSILRFKVSQSQIWPFEDTTGSHINCRTFKYKDDDPPFGDRWRSRHFKVLISMSERIFEDCNLRETKDFTVTFHNGSRNCNGTLSQDDRTTNTKMTMRLPGCRGQPRVQEFACLDSWKHGYVGDQMIVTEAFGYSNELRCWLFTKIPPDTFYLLPASQCNEGSRDKIIGGELTPIATFKLKRPKFPFEIGSKVERHNDNAIEYGSDTDGGNESWDIKVEVPNDETLEERNSRQSQDSEVEVKETTYTSAATTSLMSSTTGAVITFVILTVHIWR